MAGLYLHIPFCKQACHYCDFYFSTSQDIKDDLVDSICRELELQKDYLSGEILETIYFGGGTPSLLNEKELSKIFESIHHQFSVTENAEITLEANPDDLRFENLQMMKNNGVTRLSIGIQSFDNEILAFLNRAHTSNDAVECMTLAREVGFANISIDLIYAIPNQNDNLWIKNIKRALAFSPEHISAYSLTIEEKTVFGNWQKKGKLKGVNDEAAAAQMEVLMSTLNEAGYIHYEISNFCKPGSYSQHNTNYWRQKKYLGVGPSAHSYNGCSRQFNVSNNARYIGSLEKCKVPFEMEVLSKANKINEYLLTTLRTAWGCDLNYLLKEFNFDLLKEKESEIEQFNALRFLETKEHRLILTQKGKLLADKIASDFFVDE
jgi:oxygen-independent coproporphyrinogen-3 oxidase